MATEPKKFQPVRETPQPGQKQILTFGVGHYGNYVGPQKPDVEQEQLDAVQQACDDADAKARAKVDDLASREFGLTQEDGSAFDPKPQSE